MALLLTSLSAVPAPAFGWHLIRTPAESTAASPDWVPPSYYGYPLDVISPPGRYGGGRYNDRYNNRYGYWLADFPGPVPNSCRLPDQLRLYTSYPDTGEVYWRPGHVVSEAALTNAPVGRIQVEVPAEATVWLEGAPTKQSGTTRAFVTPPLTPGKTYVYEVKARWTEDGHEVEQKQSVSLQVGSQAAVKFPQGQPASFPLNNAEAQKVSSLPERAADGR